MLDTLLPRPVTALQSVPEDGLLKILESRSAGTGLLEVLGSELHSRGTDRDRWSDELLHQYANLLLTDAVDRLTALQAELGAGAKDATTALAGLAIMRGVESIRAQQKGALDWEWPTTDVSDLGGTGSDLAQFRHSHSGLRLCGYQVGRKGLGQAERERLLSDFFRKQLPSIVEMVHGDEYGELGSEERLQKMANVIASLTRNAKRKEADYSVAIEQWESDLENLRRNYYVAGSFPWPEVE
jgi:hypothetical protein